MKNKINIPQVEHIIKSTLWDRSTPYTIYRREEQEKHLAFIEIDYTKYEALNTLQLTSVIEALNNTLTVKVVGSSISLDRRTHTMLIRNTGWKNWE